MPAEYKSITNKEKKYTANEAFIKDKNLKKVYENRSYVNNQMMEFDEPELGVVPSQYSTSVTTTRPKSGIPRVKQPESGLKKFNRPPSASFQ